MQRARRTIAALALTGLAVLATAGTAFADDPEETCTGVYPTVWVCWPP